jgi:hypothetical protein
MAVHALSDGDRAFRSRVESCEVTPSEFDHRAHLRLAYVYLAEHDPRQAGDLMRDALLRFLAHHGIDASRYHETLTRAWIMAVRHFMEQSPGSESAETFIDANPAMLDSRIMMTHYSAELLFSDVARKMFVEPDLDPIPEHDQESPETVRKRP